MNATDLNNIATRLQSFWNRLANDPVAGTKFEGDSAVLEDAIVKLRHIAAAERAVSPAESVQSADDEELRRFMAYYADAWRKNDERNETRAFTYIDAKIAAAHAEGRRSAMEELAKEKERADRAEDHRDRLCEAIAGAAMKAGIYNGEVDLAGPHLLMLADNLAEQALAARQAPDLNRLTRYWIAADGLPYALHVRLDDVQALLAQPLQQEGGRHGRRQEKWKHIADRLNTLDKAIARSINLTEESSPRRLLYAILHDVCSEDTATPASDNLQQASTAQVEPAKASHTETDSDIFDLIRAWAATPEGKRYDAARAITVSIDKTYSKGFQDGQAIGEMNANPVPGSWKAHGLVVAIEELIAHIGAYGEIDSRHALVAKVMDEMYKLDADATPPERKTVPVPRGRTHLFDKRVSTETFFDEVTVPGPEEHEDHCCLRFIACRGPCDCKLSKKGNPNDKT